MTLDAISYMDRRVSNSTPGVSVAYAGGVTTWTLPYSVAVDGSEGTLCVALMDGGTILTVTRPAANQVAAAGADYTLRPVYIGVLYTFLLVPSTIYNRDPKGIPDTTAKLILRRFRVLCSETTDIILTIRRARATKTVESRTLPRADILDFGTTIGSRNEDTRIEISNTSPGVCAVSGLVWTGEYLPRARKV